MKPATFKIEKRIPQPAPAMSGGEHYNSKYPFAKMKVGDSFEFETDPKRHVQRAAYIYGYRKGKRFSARGNRIWRTA